MESPVIDLRLVGAVVCIQLKAASETGTAQVKVQFRTSPDGTNFDAYADNSDIVANQTLSFPNNTEGWNRIPFTKEDIANRYIQFLVSGIDTNPADTLASLYVLCEEDI